MGIDDIIKSKERMCPDPGKMAMKRMNFNMRAPIAASAMVLTVLYVAQISNYRLAGVILIAAMK